ncbi:GntR family transcriptional regulator [Thermasporomyces composti]|uniref:GntR family transcriptional regulator n=1 Tax=Thermasporomyces composti TaxID=696763 RepID=A0A3D9V6T4_THECX|nr:GntR family transcriptional regulator [Thermasporomyces composti]REF37189.1 GntR family transcriptional regulator [Thermasporomyces composti]
MAEGISPLPSQRPLGELVTDVLREMIMKGRFKPGQHLKESELANALQVSRGPVRQALARLEVEGYVELRRHRGAFVSTLTKADIEEVHTLRGAIERLAASRACTRMQGQGFAEMDAVLESMKRVDKKIDPDDAALLDLRFHDIIYAYCDHSRVQRVWSSLRGQVMAYLRARNACFPDFLEVGYIEHLELRDALALGDPQVAQDAIDKHISGAYERLKRLNLPDR